MTVVIDTSAAMAILTGEPQVAELADLLEESSERLLSAATLVELGIVLEARIGPAAAGVIERFLRDGEITVVPVDRAQSDRAVEGWRRFGKGRHRAQLNYGDCFTYGLAVTTGNPILCVGDEFAETDADVVHAGKTGDSAP